MKKIISFMLFIIIVCTFCLSAYAESNYTYTIGHTTVIFNQNTIFSEQQRAYISEIIINGNSDATTYGLMCTLFGHKYGQQESATAITHCAQASQPRCLKETFLISMCTRCEHTEVEQIGALYIECCP